MTRLPSEVHQWKDLHRKPEPTKVEQSKTFDTSGITSIRW